MTSNVGAKADSVGVSAFESFRVCQSIEKGLLGGGGLGCVAECDAFKFTNEPQV